MARELDDENLFEFIGVRQAAARGEATRRSPKRDTGVRALLLSLDALARGIEEWIFADYSFDPFPK